MLSPARPMPATLRRNQSGAFDLPSVLIGVAVVAILAVGVMAAVFGVIPWAQDRAAQQDLAAVSTAQGATYAHGGSFAGKAALVSAGWLGADTPGALQTSADTEGKCYVAVTTSKTGNRFIASSDKPTPRPLAGNDRWCSGVLVAPETTPIMVSTWNTGLAPNCREITLPVSGLKGTVTWGDGTKDSSLTHAYTKIGEVKIQIDGTFPAWGGSAWADANCLVSVDRWGGTGTTSLAYAFYNADNLKRVESIPATTDNIQFAFQNVDSDFTLGMLETSKVTDMGYMFANATAFNQPVDFDTSSAVKMSWMFAHAPVFNQPLAFDTSNANTMYAMFYGAKSFNQPINFHTPNLENMYAMFREAVSFDQPVNMDTSRVTTMQDLFYDAHAFNQPLRFDTGQVTTMNYMFNRAFAFNQPVDFNSGNVTRMHRMFAEATSFNQPVKLDTSSVESMNSMFYSAVNFNQPVDFNSSRVTDMYAMFRDSRAFNQPVKLDTSNVTSMYAMFREATVFNQPLNFSTSQVTSMQDMFYQAASFNQPLSFDTSQVTSMSYMFHLAPAFNQDLSAWDVKSIQTHTSFAGSTFAAAKRPRFP